MIYIGQSGFPMSCVDLPYKPMSMFRAGSLSFFEKKLTVLPQ